MRMDLITVPLFRILLCAALCFLFVKIYQHNLIIKLNYEKQRVENNIKRLKNERNELYAQFLTLRDGQKILHMAEQLWGMKSLSAKQIIMSGSSVHFDFLSTASSQDCLAEAGLYHLISVRGNSDACKKL
jgi:predicted phage tail protein